MRRIVRIAILAFVGISLLSPGALAQQSQFWPPLEAVLVTGGLSGPVHITHAGDGSGRLFVVEQAGRIRIIEGGSVLPAPFLDITDRVLFSGEQGLLSVAFPPLFNDSHFYVYYTNLAGDNVVARCQVTADPNVAAADPADIVLTLSHPTYANHNGGQLAFGPDGYLYISTGDGGGGDPENKAQSLNSLLGKILRIDVESGVVPYAIPAGNPYAAAADPQNLYLDEIWARGLRNPWRFSFDRDTGDLYIGDVGQSSYEEIDYQPASGAGGENYGWKIMEASHCYNALTCDQTGLTLPVAEYDRTLGRSVTGGYVYRGATYPRMNGVYFFADFVEGAVFGLRSVNGKWVSNYLLETPFNISTFGEDEQGNLYFADYAAGAIHSLQALPELAGIVRLWPVNGAATGLSSILWARVVNTGVNPLPANAQARFRVDGPQWTASNWVGSASVAGLAPGAAAWYRLNWTVPASAAAGLYTYRAQVWTGAAPLSGMSDGQQFDVANLKPAPISLIAPKTTEAGTLPTYAWNVDDAATWYYLWINDAGGTPILKQWYTAQESEFGRIAAVRPNLPLSNGQQYRWWVLGWNSNGYGPWSPVGVFTVDTASAPGAATGIAPEGAGASVNPLFTWTSVGGASWYYVWINNASGTPVLRQWITAAGAGAGAGPIGSYAPSLNLAPGNYTWWVQTWNANGYGRWSAPVRFSVP